MARKGIFSIHYQRTGKKHQELDGIALDREEANRKLHQYDDPNLRSCKTIVGYYIHAIDGDIGHVSGLIIEENTMAVRYFIVDTTNWFGGRKVLISPEWINKMEWSDNSVTIDLTCNKIKEAPEYQSNKELNRENEVAVYEHYGLSGYWGKGENVSFVKKD